MDNLGYTVWYKINRVGATSQFNENNNTNVSSKTIWRSLKWNGYRICVYKNKDMDPSGALCEHWCANKRTWAVENDLQNKFLWWESDCFWKWLYGIYQRRSDESWLPKSIFPGTGKKISAKAFRCFAYHCVFMLCRVNATSIRRKKHRYFGK